ncbi:MAG: hypothetical protein ABIQ95_04790 [Bdellovibrionia bacterium]
MSLEIMPRGGFKPILLLVVLTFVSNIAHAADTDLKREPSQKKKSARVPQSLADKIKKVFSGGAKRKTLEVSVPEITVVELFSNLLIDTDDYEGWKVTGEGMGQLVVWTRPNQGEGNAHSRKEALAQAQRNEAHGTKVVVQQMTEQSIPLTQETRVFFDGVKDSGIHFDGSLEGVEYVFDPASIHETGSPISFYLVKPMAQGSASHSSLSSKMAEWAKSYDKKASEFKSRGFERLAQKYSDLAFLVLKQSAAASGDSLAMLELGKRSEKAIAAGQGNLIEALDWFQKAAHAGNAEAKAMLDRPGFLDSVHLIQETQHGTSPKLELKLAAQYALGSILDAYESL